MVKLVYLYYLNSVIGKSKYIFSIQRVGVGVRSDIEIYIEWFHEKHHEIL